MDSTWPSNRESMTTRKGEPYELANAVEALPGRSGARGPGRSAPACRGRRGQTNEGDKLAANRGADLERDRGQRRPERRHHGGRAPAPGAPGRGPRLHGLRAGGRLRRRDEDRGTLRPL